MSIVSIGSKKIVRSVHSVRRVLESIEVKEHNEPHAPCAMPRAMVIGTINPID